MIKITVKMNNNSEARRLHGRRVYGALRVEHNGGKTVILTVRDESDAQVIREYIASGESGQGVIGSEDAV